MHSLRLHDPDRTPPSWSDIVRPHQIVVFARRWSSGLPCDGSGVVFADPDAASCLVFDALDEAVAFCEAQVQREPDLAFEVFDSAGRARPPLLRIVHPSVAARSEGSPAAARRRTLFAVVLIAAALPLFWIDWRARGGLILPTFIGINLILVALRLLFLNFVHRESAVRQGERLAEYRAGAPADGERR